MIVLVLASCSWAVYPEIFFGVAIHCNTKLKSVSGDQAMERHMLIHINCFDKTQCPIVWWRRFNLHETIYHSPRHFVWRLWRTDHCSISPCLDWILSRSPRAVQGSRVLTASVDNRFSVISSACWMVAGCDYGQFWSNDSPMFSFGSSDWSSMLGWLRATNLGL